jgi:hypothetical protein
MAIKGTLSISCHIQRCMRIYKFSLRHHHIGLRSAWIICRFHLFYIISISRTNLLLLMICLSKTSHCSYFILLMFILIIRWRSIWVQVWIVSRVCCSLVCQRSRWRHSTLASKDLLLVIQLLYLLFLLWGCLAIPAIICYLICCMRRNIRLVRLLLLQL